MATSNQYEGAMRQMMSEEDSSSCPIATQDITVNLKNRAKAITAAAYGPENPNLPNTAFWQKKADTWDVSIEDAKKSRCGNCAVFVVSDEMRNCIADVLDEIQGRLKVINELRIKIQIAGIDEVKELQPLFAKGLWMFGDKFESIHFTSNKGMTTVIRELFDGKADKASLNRPDFVIRGDGSTGFYSLPSYNEEYQEVGVHHLVIVDLKTTKLSLGSKEKEQIWKYVKELKKKGYIQSGTRVDGFVLGDQIESGEGGTRTEDNDNVKIQPLLYSVILNRAEQRLLKLYDKVKEAPFLLAQQEELSKFIEPVPIQQPGLVQSEAVAK